MTAIKLKTKTAPIAHNERKWLLPSRTFTTMFDTITQGVSDAMTTLHDRTSTTF